MIKLHLPEMAEPSVIVMEEVADPVELVQARQRRARFDRNWAWLQAHATQVYETHRGKVICVAGEEVFSADTALEAVALARAAHPEDEGRFTKYIPKEKLIRVYAHQW